MANIQTFKYEGCLPYRGDTGIWTDYVGTGLSCDITVNTAKKNDTIEITIDTDSFIVSTGLETFSGPGAYLIVTAQNLYSDASSSAEGYLYGQNNASVEAFRSYKKSFTITLDRDTVDRTGKVYIIYRPTFKGHFQTSTNNYITEGVHAAYFECNFTIPAIEKKLTLNKTDGVESFYAENYNSSNGSNTYLYTYNTYATTKLTAKTGYLLTKITGTKYNDASANADFTGCNGKTSDTASDWIMRIDRTLTAYASPITYTIAYNGNNATSGTMSSSSHTYDTAKNLTENSFTRTGYLFNGWNTNANGTGTPYANKASVKNLTSTNNSTITLYAQWRPITYTIKFNTNGGNGSMVNQTITYGVPTAINPNAFSRPGYAFTGWCMYRQSDKKWNYTTPSGSTGWYTTGSQPSDAVLSQYADGFKTSTDSTVDGDVIILYPQWKVLAAIFAKDQNNNFVNGTTYLRTDSGYVISSGVYVKVNGEWKLSII